MTLTYEEVYKLITDQKERNFGKWQELIQELAKSIGKVQHPTYFSKGEQHALTKILRRNGLKPELKNYVVLQRLKAHFRSRDVPKT